MFEVGSTSKCPHCRTAACFIATSDRDQNGTRHGGISTQLFASTNEDTLHVYTSACPECHKVIAVFKRYDAFDKFVEERLVYPLNVARILPPEVPKDIGNDFSEAAAVLPISEKASAALSRRCLQNVLTENGFRKKDLNDQIDDALPTLPTRISENLDAIRNIGNFGVHALKHQSTGLIADVEPEEANWNLDVLEDLFDFYYVQPKRAEERRKKLEEKLKDLKKPPMKKPS